MKNLFKYLAFLCLSLFIFSQDSAAQSNVVRLNRTASSATAKQTVHLVPGFYRVRGTTFHGRIAGGGSVVVPPTTNSRQLFNSIPGLKNFVRFDIFDKAMKGFGKQRWTKSNLLTIVDFTKKSDQPRFLVIDINAKRVLYRTPTAHGKNSDPNHNGMATHFSNVPNSNKSSLGFYKTAETYHGKNGYSLRLDGLEYGINNNARRRAIVVHGASYVKTNGQNSGRSLGCPALAWSVYKQIIDKIKGGSCLFIYADNQNYLGRSRMIK